MRQPIRLRAPIHSHITITTDCRGLSGYQTPRELEAHAENMAVVIAQPHRQPVYDSGGVVIASGEDRRLEGVFGRFCAGHKPRPLGDHCYYAGLRYAEIVREYKNAMGFDVAGWAPSDLGYATLTEAQVAARKDLAVIRKREADEVLFALMPRLPARMERLCFDELQPSPYDEALLVDGLVLLARKFGLQPRSLRNDA